MAQHKCVLLRVSWQLCTEHDVPGFVKFKMFDAKRKYNLMASLFCRDWGLFVFSFLVMKVAFFFSPHDSMLAIMSVWILLVSFTASSKTISGLLEFDSKTEAVEVLTVLNHYQIRIPSESGQQVFSWKWCTSRPLFFFFDTCVLLFQMGPIRTPWSCVFPPHLISEERLICWWLTCEASRGGGNWQRAEEEALP